jgi:hypothetical protein
LCDLCVLARTNNVIGTGKDAKIAQAAADESAKPAQMAGNLAANGLLHTLGAGGGLAGAATGNPLLMAASAIPTLAGSAPVQNAGQAILSKLASNGVKEGAAKLIAPTLVGTSQFLAHAPNYVSGGINQTGDTTMQQSGISAQPGTTSGQSPTEQMLQMAMIGMQDPYLAQTYAPIVQSLLTGPLQHASSAQSALQSAESAFNQAGGGQGMIGGLLSKLGGALTGGPSSTYGDQRAQLIAQLNAMGVPTSAVPDITNTPGAAASQFSALQNLIQSVGTGTGGGAPLLAGVR